MAGTTGAAAALLNRHFVGAEIDPDYWSITKDRIIQARDGTLAFRNFDQPVFDPSKAGAVAPRPAHFVWAAPTTPTVEVEA